MRNALLLALAIGSFSVLGGASKANAQAAFAGNYNMLGGYTSGGYWKGLYYKGYVTATSSGEVAYSAYFPFSGYPAYGSTGYGSGKIGPRGVFVFSTTGVYGAVRIILEKYCLGYFYDSLGSGYFALTKF